MIIFTFRSFALIYFVEKNLYWRWKECSDLSEILYCWWKYMSVIDFETKSFQFLTGWMKLRKLQSLGVHWRLPMKVLEQGIPWQSKGLELSPSIAKGYGLMWYSQREKKKKKVLGQRGILMSLGNGHDWECTAKKKKKMWICYQYNRVLGGPGSLVLSVLLN